MGIRDHVELCGGRDDRLQMRNVRGEVARLDWPRFGVTFLVEFLLPGWATKALTRSPDHTRRDLENSAVTI